MRMRRWGWRQQIKQININFCDHLARFLAKRRCVFHSPVYAVRTIEWNVDVCVRLEFAYATANLAFSALRKFCGAIVQSALQYAEMRR